MRRGVLGVVGVAVFVTAAWAAPLAPRVTIALVKVARGGTWIQRAGTLYPVRVGTPVWESDVLMTGMDGAIGVTFLDESLISLGPNSAFGIIRYAYDPVTHAGRFEAVFHRGTMSATTGRMIRQAPDTMLISTPQSIIRPHGTNFLVQVEEVR